MVVRIAVAMCVFGCFWLGETLLFGKIIIARQVVVRWHFVKLREAWAKRGVGCGQSG